MALKFLALDRVKSQPFGAGFALILTSARLSQGIVIFVFGSSLVWFVAGCIG